MSAVDPAQSFSNNHNYNYIVANIISVPSRGLSVSHSLFLPFPIKIAYLCTWLGCGRIYWILVDFKKWFEGERMALFC